MIMDFVAVSMDQIVNQMAKMKYMLGGQATLPIVVTTHAGIDSSSAAQHSGSLEAWFCPRAWSEGGHAVQCLRR